MAVKRKVGKPFPKGKSGNPGGRSKKDRELEALAQAALTKGKQNVAVEALKAIAEDHYEQTKDRIKALELLMAYAYGKPRQRTEITGNEGGPLGVTINVKPHGR